MVFSVLSAVMQTAKLQEHISIWSRFLGLQHPWWQAGAPAVRGHLTGWFPVEINRHTIRQPVIMSRARVSTWKQTGPNYTLTKQYRLEHTLSSVLKTNLISGYSEGEHNDEKELCRRTHSEFRSWQNLLCLAHFRIKARQQKYEITQMEVWAICCEIKGYINGITCLGIIKGPQRGSVKRFRRKKVLKMLNCKKNAASRGHIQKSLEKVG